MTNAFITANEMHLKGPSKNKIQSISYKNVWKSDIQFLEKILFQTVVVVTGRKKAM